MTTVLITGASRGLGLGLVQHFLKHANPPRLIIAACRTPETATELKEIAKNDSRVVVIQLDQTKIDSFPDVYKKVDALVGGHGLNVLVNNAGIGTRKILELADDFTPEEFRAPFETNAVGPVFLTKALLPLIRRAEEANRDKPLGISRAAVFFMSSLLGSISLNLQSEWQFWAYRESKAALNMSAVTFGNQLGRANILVCTLHPGHVLTELGGKNAQLTVDESVSGMMKVIYLLDKSKHNKFIQWDGAELTW